MGLLCWASSWRVPVDYCHHHQSISHHFLEIYSVSATLRTSGLLFDPFPRRNSCAPRKVKFVWGQSLFLALGLAAPVIAVFDFGIQHREASKDPRTFQQGSGAFVQGDRGSTDVWMLLLWASALHLPPKLFPQRRYLHRRRYRSP